MFIAVLAFSFQHLAGAFGLDWTARMGYLAESGGSGRLIIWSNVFAALAAQDFPYWFLGHGYGALAIDVRWAHNDFLEILYDFGLIALAIYVMFVARIVSIFLEMKRLRYRHFAAFAASLVWAVAGAMNDVLINYPYWFLAIAMFWGITIADFENAKRQEYFSESEDPVYEYQYYDEEAVDVSYV